MSYLHKIKTVFELTAFTHLDFVLMFFFRKSKIFRQRINIT